MNLNHFYHYYKSKSGGVSNLLLGSEELGSTGVGRWNQDLMNAVNSDQVNNPEGTEQTADQLDFQASKSAKIRQDVTLVAGTEYTFSIWARAASGTQPFRLRYYDNVGGSGGASAFTATATWTPTTGRYSFTFTAANSGTFTMMIQNAADAVSRRIYFWGAMLNVGATAADYIKTTFTGPSSPATPLMEFGDNFAGVTAYYSLRRFTIGEDTNAIRVRRSSDDTEQDIGFDSSGDLDTTALTTFVNADVDIYTSDFSITEDLNESNGTGAAAQSIGGVDDAYKFTTITGTGQMFANTSTLPFSGKGGGNSFRIQADVYLPSTNAEIDKVRIWTGYGLEGFVEVTTTDSWVSIDQTITITSGSSLRFQAYDGSDITPTTTGANVFYLKNIVVTQTTADGAVTTFYDQSGNGNNATNATASEQPLVVSGGSVESLGGEVTPVRQGVTTTLDISGVESSVTGAFTIATRFYLSSQSDSDCIFGGRGLTSGAGLCASYLSGRWRFEVITTTGTRAIVSVSDTNTPINNWYNVVFTWDGTTDSNAVKVYLNTSSNIFTATANGTVINYDASYPMSIFNADRNSFDGGLATWTIFNSQITDIDGLFTAITP